MQSVFQEANGPFSRTSLAATSFIPFKPYLLVIIIPHHKRIPSFDSALETWPWEPRSWFLNSMGVVVLLGFRCQPSRESPFCPGFIADWTLPIVFHSWIIRSRVKSPCQDGLSYTLLCARTDRGFFSPDGTPHGSVMQAEEVEFPQRLAQFLSLQRKQAVVESSCLYNQPVVGRDALFLCYLLGPERVLRH